MFDDAWQDAGNLQNWQGDYRISACFINPMLPNSEKFEIEVLHTWIEAIKRELSPDMIAWAFPESSRELNNSNTKKIYPGVCLSMKLRKRANKNIN